MWFPFFKKFSIFSDDRNSISTTETFDSKYQSSLHELERTSKMSNWLTRENFDYLTDDEYAEFLNHLSKPDR